MGLNDMSYEVKVTVKVHCEKCDKSSDDDWPVGKVWCHKLGRYMDKSGYCSFGDERKNDK